MTTSALASAIHCLDFSKPENTRFQYGSSVCLLSIAAPIAGTCDDATPAMILATFRPRLAACLRFRLTRFRLARFRPVAANQHAGGLPPRLAAIAFHVAPALQHHVGIVFLRGA